MSRQVYDYIFSNKNLSNLANKMVDVVHMDNEPDAIRGCQQWLGNIMKKIVNSNHDNMRGDPKEIVKNLNSMCIKQAVTLYRKKEKKQEQRSESMGTYKMERENEIHGSRKNRITKRPKSMSTSKKNNREKSGGGGLMGVMDDMGGGGNYASVTEGFDGAITADGRKTKGLFFGNVNDALMFGDKRTAAAEMERRMLQRKGEYEPHPGGDMGGGDGMMGMMGNGMTNGMGNGMGIDGMMGYGSGMPGPFGGMRQRPQEINFCIDGGNTSRGRDREMLEGNGYGGLDGMNQAGMMGNQMGMMGNQMGMMGNQMGMMGNQMGMEGMGNVGFGDNGFGKMGEQDFMNRAAQLQNDRGYDGGAANMMNPMMNNQMGNQMGNQMNPQMMQYMQMMQQFFGNNNQNFIKGGRGGDPELRRGVDSIKSRIAEDLSIDPQLLKNMDSEEIAKMIKRQKHSNKKLAKISEDSESDSTQDSDSERNKKTKRTKTYEKKGSKGNMVSEMITKLVEARRLQKQKEQDLDSADRELSEKRKNNKQRNKKKSRKSSSSTEESNTTSSSSSSTKAKLKKKQNDEKKKLFTKVPNNTKRKGKSESSDESSEESQETSKVSNISKPKVTISKTRIPDKNIKIISDSETTEESVPPESSEKEKKGANTNMQTDVTVLLSDDNEYCCGEPNNFLVDFEDKSFKNGPFNSVTNIDIKKSSFPKLVPLITRNTYKLHILCDELDDDKLIELDDGECKLDQLIDGINSALEDLNITCKVDKKGKVTFEQTDGHDFIIDCSENSFAKLLGFTEDEYYGSSCYTSEKSNAFDQKAVYVYFKNLSKKPVAKVDTNGTLTQLESEFSVQKLSQIIVHIRSNITDDEQDLYSFNDNESPSMTLQITHGAKKDNKKPDVRDKKKVLRKNN